MATILLVDDEPSVRLFYSDVLADNGYHVIEAASDNEAMRMIHQEPPDLVALAIKFGSHSGLDLLQHIVRSYPRLPVVLLSTQLSFQDDDTTWLADSYVLKSSDPGEFLQEIDRVLRRAEGRMPREPRCPAGLDARAAL